MKINDLSIIELKAYFDLLYNKIKDVNTDIKINGENIDKINFRYKLYRLKALLEKEISKRINELEFE